LCALDSLHEYSPVESTGKISDDSFPRNMLGAAIEAVIDWILEVGFYLCDLFLFLCLVAYFNLIAYHQYFNLTFCCC